MDAAQLDLPLAIIYLHVLYRHHRRFFPLGPSLSLFIAKKAHPDENMASAPPPTEAILEKKSSHSSASVDNEKQNPPHGDAEALVVDSRPMTASHLAATALSVS